MSLSWRLILRILAVLIVIASIVWLIVQPGPEPIVGLLSAVAALLTSLSGEEKGPGHHLPEQ